MYDFSIKMKGRMAYVKANTMDLFPFGVFAFGDGMQHPTG